MKSRLHLTFPLLCLLLVPAAAKAQGTPPTFVMRFASLDSLVENAKFLAGLGGQKDAARQIEGQLKTKGMEGIDGKRPLGAYGKIGKELDDITGAILVPISDEKAFLDLLKGANLQTIKGADGIYTVKNQMLPIDVYVRFANKYAYITALKQTALEDKNLLDPAKVLAGQPTNTFSLTIQLNQIPDIAKQIAMSYAEAALQDADKKPVPGETPAQRAFRAAALKEVTKYISLVLKDGKELSVGVDINKPTGDIAAYFTLSGMPGSELAGDFNNFAKTPSMFGGLLRKDAAFNGLGRLKLSPPLVQALGAVYEEFRTSHTQSIPDASMRQQADALLKALAPTVQTGDFDSALVLMENAKKQTFVAAAKIKDGVAVDKNVRDALGLAIKNLPAELKTRIKIDADAVGAVKIHKGELGGLGPKEFDATLGDPNVYIAVRPDAIFVSGGKDGLQAIKAAIPVAPTASTPMFLYDLDVARVAFLVAPSQPELATKFFPSGQGGTLRISVEGGSAISARLNTKVSVLNFFGAVAEAAQKK